MSSDVNDLGQPGADDDEPPVVADKDADGRDEADDIDEDDPSPKTDVPSESDADEVGGA
jgi:hypothetical protein